MHSEVLAIVGPTASGKTDLALHLARERNGEIISVDSRQIYRDLSIGTAKPIGRWQSGPTPDTGTYIVQDIPYHMVDFLPPSESFSAARFADYAEEKIQDIQNRGKTPILAGGTGFYLKALMGGLAPLPSADPAIRADLQAIADAKGRPFLHAELARVDPEAAAEIPFNNIHRVVRALEVFRLSGKPLSHWHREHRSAQAESPAKKRFTIWGLDPGVERLKDRIALRCTAMIDHGMIEETRALLAQGIPENSPALSGLGYPRVIAYLKDALSKDALLRFLIQDTRQYAKRQRTWFRTQLEVTWKKLLP
jgi:tRNA dimethylallyltransferase